MIKPDIYSYILEEENTFETEEVKVGDNWDWNFRKHVQLIFHLFNGVFYTGSNNFLRAFKAIMKPLIRLSIWTEDLEVKDVVFFIESQTGRALSFLIKKYHDEVYTREHDLDTMFDQITENDITYGGALAQKAKGRPEILPFNSIAFCDQTDILGGPLFFKHYFSPDKLRGMSKLGWGDEKNGADISLEDLCTLATFEKDSGGTLSEKKNQVPGKTIEVYIGRGNFPEHYLKDNDNFDYYCNQIQIRAFYTTKDSKQEGVCLYRKKEAEGNLKFHSSEPVYQRALGFSDGEAMVHPQIWENFLTIHKMAMLEAGSKSPLVTDDPSWTQKNKIQDMENLEVTTIEDGKSVSLVPTISPVNVQLFEKSIDEWYQQGQLATSANDPLLGKEAVSGTTFRGQERVVAQGRGWHDRRRGQRAKFIESIYRDWIIPDIVKEITSGKKFLATLSTEELTWVSDQLATNAVNKRIKEIILKGGIVSKEEQKLMMETFKQDFTKKGNKHLLEILKDQFDGIEVKIGINIANKQKNLADLSDKVLSIIQFAFQDPARFNATLQIPGMAQSFSDILEFSGLSPVSFSEALNTQAQMQAQQPKPSPLQAPQLTPA